MERLKAFLFIVCAPLIAQHYVIWCFKGNFIPDENYGISAIVTVVAILALSVIYSGGK